MDATATGIALIALAVVVGAATVFTARSQVDRPLAVVLFATSGAAAGTGALLLQEPRPDLVNWAVTVVFLAVMTPVHMHLVFGSGGRGATA